MNEPRKRWTEEETKLALFLYFQLPFGQLHSGNPEIQKLASILGRTNSSVAMKLCNFASLDPKITETGRKGLQGASAQDRSVWAQFSGDWTAQIEEAERVWKASEVEPSDARPRLRENAMPFAFEPYDGPSTTAATVERRVGQNFFRRAVLANFENTCCITGIAEPTLLNASHIVPWGIDVKNRHNPANGLCLSATLDRLAMLAAKSVCKERWRQILPEADRIAIKHLVTLEPGITSAQTDQMQAHDVQLIVPLPIQSSYTHDQGKWLWSVERFVQHIREKVLP